MTRTIFLMSSYIELSDDSEKTAPVHHLVFDYYLHEEIYSRVDLLINQNNPPRDIHEAHCRTLAELFCNYKYIFTRDMITV